MENLEMGFNNFYFPGLENYGFYMHQGCCLTGAQSPGAPKLRVRATKFLFKEPAYSRCLSIDFPFSCNDFNFLVTLFH